MGLDQTRALTDSWFFYDDSTKETQRIAFQRLGKAVVIEDGETWKRVHEMAK